MVMMMMFFIVVRRTTRVNVSQFVNIMCSHCLFPVSNKFDCLVTMVMMIFVCNMQTVTMVSFSENLSSL
jgi:hypothetical protein